MDEHLIILLQLVSLINFCFVYLNFMHLELSERVNCCSGWSAIGYVSEFWGVSGGFAWSATWGKRQAGWGVYVVQSMITEVNMRQVYYWQDGLQKFRCVNFQGPAPGCNFTYRWLIGVPHDYNVTDFWTHIQRMCAQQPVKSPEQSVAWMSVAGAKEIQWNFLLKD